MKYSSKNVEKDGYLSNELNRIKNSIISCLKIEFLKNKIEPSQFKVKIISKTDFEGDLISKINSSKQFSKKLNDKDEKCRKLIDHILSRVE